MSRKLAILFAVLAIAYVANCVSTTSAIGTASPSSAFSVATGNIFTNATDTDFTNLTGTCYFTAGFDNTTHYVWCEAQTTTNGNSQTIGASWGETIALVLERRAINASSPSTKNATLDTKITTTAMYTNNGKVCAGVGYLGIGYDYVASGTQTDVTFQYYAVNGSTATSVKITSNSDTDLENYFLDCFFDDGIFYVIYEQYSVTAATYTKNKVLIQGVNVTSGTVLYNTTGGETLMSPTSGAIDTYFGYEGTFTSNWTGWGSTYGLVIYTDNSGTAQKTNLLPVTLSSGTAGSAVLLATDSTSAAATVTTSSANSGSSTCLSTTVITTNQVTGGFGSLSTYGVLVRQTVSTTPYSDGGATTTGWSACGVMAAVTASETTVYTNSIFLNGSSSASTSFNLTADPSGMYVEMAQGYSTNDGFGIITTYASTTAGNANQINLDTFYANGSSLVSGTSLGTYGSSGCDVQIWIDSVGSPWLGYILTETNTNAADGTGYFLLSAGYAGEIAYVMLSANALTSIFATLALMIAALVAF